MGACELVGKGKAGQLEKTNSSPLCAARLPLPVYCDHKQSAAPLIVVIYSVSGVGLMGSEWATK